MAKTLKDLPHELMVEIFLRMPARSVGRCRCLSKTWRYHLSTSQFINLHLTRKNHQENLICITRRNSLQTITIPIVNNAVSKKFELEGTWGNIGGSCNGLVLLVNDREELFLINPVTTQKVNIPDPNYAFPRVDHVYGFGYDISSDDYKIVVLSSDVITRDRFVDLYSVKRGVWKRVTSSYNVDCPFHSGVFVNGAIHWLSTSSSKPSVIAAFDLASEVFYEIPTPDTNNWEVYILRVLGGRLYLVDNNDLWTMKKYGSVESWTKLFRFGKCFCGGEHGVLDVVINLCFIKNDEIVLSTLCGYKWVVCNVKEGTTKEFVVDGVPVDFRDETIFFDSLVSPGL